MESISKIGFTDRSIAVTENMESKEAHQLNYPEILAFSELYYRYGLF